MAERMDEGTLRAIIAQEISTAETYYGGEYSEGVEKSREYFHGVMNDIKPLANHSSVTSHDLSDTIGWMLPGIIEVFMASDRMVEYTPESPGDEDFTAQSTDMANYVFLEENDGYNILYETVFDSLLHGNGIPKLWWDPTPVRRTSFKTGLNQEQMNELDDNPDIQILSGDVSPTGDEITVQDPETGEYMTEELVTYDVKIQETTAPGRIRLEVVDPADFLMNPDALRMEDARFLAHRDEKTRSELIEMGFDRDKVDALPLYSSRDAKNDDYLQTGDKSAEKIEIYECFIDADVDGDGVSETVRVYYAGQQSSGEILDWEVWEDERVFYDIQCEPVSHQWQATSMSDKTMDIQRIKTTLQRQGMDNTYAVNHPLREVEEGSVQNMDMLLNPKFGGVILKRRGSNPIMPHVLPYTADKSFGAIQYFDEVLQRRTGVSRQSMALDAEELTNETATANNNAKDAAYSKIALIARNMANGWEKLFKGMLRLLVKHQQRAKTIRVRGEWVEMNPRYWNANMNCRVEVGLGTGSKERDMMMLQATLQNQMMAAQSLRETGMTKNALQYIPLIRKTMVKIAEAAGFKNADSFYPEFDPQDLAAALQMAEQAKQQQPVQIQIEQARSQGAIQLQQAKSQAEMQSEQVQAQAAMEQEQARIQGMVQLESVKAQTQLQIASIKSDMQERIGRAGLGVKLEAIAAQTASARDKEMAQLEADITLERERRAGMSEGERAKADNDVAEMEFRYAELEQQSQDAEDDRALKVLELGLKYDADEGSDDGGMQPPLN